jgi:hypothetical protein
VLEVLVNDAVAITARVYSAPGTPLMFDVHDPDGLESLHVWGIRAISRNRLTQ